MFTVVPDYYGEFHCIADKCTHTCCKGWEIDIDPASLARYQQDGIGHISVEGEPHFELDGEERCPYLNSRNLCALIIEHGEGYLCQICRDHPRFRSYWETGEEIGLGLCCEAAAALILNRSQPMTLVITDDETGKTVSERDFTATLPEDERFLFYYRKTLLEAKTDLPAPLARFREYLIFRHIPNALYDDRLQEREAFVEETVQTAYDLWQRAGGGAEDLCSLVRDFSENAEYDDVLLDELLEADWASRTAAIAECFRPTDSAKDYNYGNQH